MTTSHFKLFGMVAITEEQYLALLDNLRSQREKIQELESQYEERSHRMAEIQSNSDRQRETIQQFREDIKKIEVTNQNLDELIDGIKTENHRLYSDLSKAQEELNAIKESYRKTLAINADLEIKLEDAIADLSKSEQTINESLVQLSSDRTSRRIHLENCRTAVLTALNNLEVQI